MSAVMINDEELVDRVTRLIQERTGRTVRGLQVNVQEGRIVLSGLSPSYYYKQLASHAAMEELTDLHVANEIQVS